MNFRERLLTAYLPPQTTLPLDDPEWVQTIAKITGEHFYVWFGKKPDKVELNRATLDGVTLEYLFENLQLNGTWGVVGTCPYCGKSTVSPAISISEYDLHPEKQFGRYLADFQPNETHLRTECSSSGKSSQTLKMALAALLRETTRAEIASRDISSPDSEK